MKLDLDKVQAILDNKSITYGDIVNFTGMSKGAIRPYRIGERPITKMQIENALKFQELYDKKQKEREIMNKEAIKKFVEEEIWENIIWENMEAVLYSDGDHLSRQEGSAGMDEDEIVYTIPLSFAYWSDSYAVTENENGELVKEENEKEYFIDDMTDQIYEDIV